MGEECIFMTVARKMLWISRKKLKNLGKEHVVWEQPLSPAPLSRVDLPDMKGINLFVFDSEIYMGGGGLTRPSEIDEKGAASTFTIYQFEMDKKKFTMTDSISPPPTVFAPTFMGNISDAVYLLVFRGPNRPTKDGFWVLSPSGQWKRLSSPEPLYSYGNLVLAGGCLTLQDKLLFRVRTLEGKPCLHLFDPATEKWKQIKYGLHNSWIDSLYYVPGVMLSLPGLRSNSSVALSWTFRHTDKHVGYVLIEALLVNNQNLAVRVRQSLWECLEGTQPPSHFDISSIRPALVDLGDDMVCALVYGHTEDHHGGNSPVLCMSVFTLALLEEPDMDKEIDTEVITKKRKIDTEASQKKQEHKFLSVHVIVKRVFAMEDCDNGYWHPVVLRPFMFRPKMELPD